MSLSHSPKVVTDGLVLYLDAANQRSYPKSGTTWSDLKGSNDGTLTNGATFDSANRGSILLDGTSEYVDFGASNILNTTTAHTIQFWIKMLSMPSSVTPPIRIKSNSQDLVILISARSGYEGVTIGSGGTWAQGKTLTSSDFFLNNWVNICVTYNGAGSNTLGNHHIYENLVDKSLTSGTPGLLGSTTDTRFGYINSSNYMNANISNFTIYNRLLTSEEIKQNYLATRGRYK